jgi:hypothetical protein
VLGIDNPRTSKPFGTSSITRSIVPPFCYTTQQNCLQFLFVCTFEDKNETKRLDACEQKKKNST